jgi:hypothetical protein
MPKFVRKAGFGLLLLASAACSDTTAPLSIGQARTLWESHHLSTYSYFGTQECFCAITNGPVRVDVSAGVVSAVTDMTTNARIPTTGWLTIEQLFDLAETLQPQPVEFDHALGFPKKVERCCMADDSGSTYTVSSVT